jgi:Protein of unknown function (DUF1573)
MLRWVILVVAVVFLTGAATLVFQYLPESEEAPKVPVVAPEAVTGPQPKIQVEGDMTYDFGKMAKRDEATHAWVVKNVGEAPLEIWQEGETTCSCTVAKPGLDADKKPIKMVIPPGGSDNISLSWHTKKDLPEDYSQGAKFGTNDPRMPLFLLQVKGKVYPAVMVYPPEMIQLASVSNEEPHEVTIAIYSKERPDLKLTQVSTSRPELIVASARPMKPDEAKGLQVEKGNIVTVKVKPGMPLGDFHDAIIIQTDHPKEPEVRVSIGGHVYGPISVTPERVRKTDVVSQKGATLGVTLVVRGDKGTKFEVVSKPKLLEVDISRDEKSPLKGRYRMNVKVPPGAPTGTVAGDIVLKTDNPMASELKIPVSILITRGGAG